MGAKNVDVLLWGEGVKKIDLILWGIENFGDCSENITPPFLRIRKDSWFESDKIIVVGEGGVKIFFKI